MTNSGKIVLLFPLLFIAACGTPPPKRAMHDSGMMYGMVYDYENIPVSAAAVYIDGEKYIETDIQGRFVMEFAESGEHIIKLVKNGYEEVEEVFQYDPFRVLYFKMVNVNQLVSMAEGALERYAYRDAEPFLDRALLLEPLRPDILYLKSIVLYFQGKKSEARVLLEFLQELGIEGEYISELLKRVSDCEF
jgi:hypothetical protein